MGEDLGTSVGVIWKKLHTKSELSLSQPKKHTESKPRFQLGHRLACL